MLAPVYWILAAVFIVIALTRPRLRPLGIVGCIILGAMLAWGMVQRLRSEDPSRGPAAQQRGKPASPATALRSVPLTMVAAQDVSMSGSGAPFQRARSHRQQYERRHAEIGHDPRDTS